jgi:hypothetical protein
MDVFLNIRLKVYKHEIFFGILLQKPKPYGPRACNTRFLKIVFDSAEIFASDEIHSAYAQCAMKFFPRMLSMDLHVKTVRTSKFWRKSKEKKRNFFRKFTTGI